MSNMKSIRHKMFETLLALSIVFAFSAVTAVFAADVYPSKPVRIICPWSPGANTDAISRMMADKLSARLGERVIVENRPGAGGTLGAEIAAKADPDGYTLLIVQDAHFTPRVYPPRYDIIESFVPVARLGGAWRVMVAHVSVPANTLKELVELAKQKPGQLLYASMGVGSIAHFLGELLKMNTGGAVKIVQFKSGAAAITDVVGGHSHLTVGAALSTFIPFLKADKLKAISICGPERNVALPDTHTAVEDGFPWFQSNVWFAIVAPTGTPAPVVDRLGKEIKAILATNEIKEWWLARGMTVDYLGSTDLRPFFKEQLTKWADIVKMANIKLQ